MKLVVILRTLNEERFIARCCQNHQFADLILMADGGSRDNTVSIASQHRNIYIRRFYQRIHTGSSFFNPEPAHTNFLIKWAERAGADWIIFTDADTWPHLALQRDARQIFQRADKEGFKAVLRYNLYLWGDNEYFPKINEAGPSLWAWKASLKLRCDESGDTFFDTVFPGPSLEECMSLNSNHVCLHYFSDEKREAEKMARYAAMGHPKTHILESIYAPPEPLPGWVMQ